MWAASLPSFTSPHWYFGAHIFNEMLKAVRMKKNFLSGNPWINFHIIFMHTSLYDVDPMKSLTLENVLSVTNGENKSES